MWYSDLGTISIGMQSGLADGGLGVLKVGLYQALIKRCKKTYCPAVDHFALGLFVSGRLYDFGPATIERIRRSRKTRCSRPTVARGRRPRRCTRCSCAS